MSGPLPGWVSIRGLRCQAKQGLTPEQRAAPSEYLVDLSCHADLSRAVALDDVAAAVDIARIAETVRRAMSARPRALVERMCADVARALLETFTAVDEVRVRVEKQRPEGLDADAESIEIAMTRENVRP